MAASSRNLALERQVHDRADESHDPALSPAASGLPAVATLEVGSSHALDVLVELVGLFWAGCSFLCNTATTPPCARDAKR